ncbi:MAG: hypothetical protein Q9165_006775 [Trypethelium subeluteriae]
MDLVYSVRGVYERVSKSLFVNRLGYSTEPTILVKRWASIREMLTHENAASHGAEFVFSAKAVKVDADTGIVNTTEGRRFQADLIVGADVWDEYAYRCLADRDEMLTTSPTATLSNNGNTNFFLGPAGILLCYPCNQGKSFNIVAPCHRPVNKEAHDSFNPEVDPVELVDAYKDFFSPVPELLNSIKKCVKWTIVHLPQLPTYSSENGRIVLLGDAAHAMLPAAASASNMAVEDAAALSECVSACKDASELNAAVKAYEAIRKRRNDRVWEISMISQRNVSSYTAKSYNDAVAARNEGLRKATEELAEHLKLSRKDRKALQASQVGDEAAIYPSPALLKWLYGHDTITVLECRCTSTQALAHTLDRLNHLVGCRLGSSITPKFLDLDLIHVLPMTRSVGSLEEDGSCADLFRGMEKVNAIPIKGRFLMQVTSDRGSRWY